MKIITNVENLGGGQKYMIVCTPSYYNLHLMILILTWSKNQRTRLPVHGEVGQHHWTPCFYCESEEIVSHFSVAKASLQSQMSVCFSVCHQNPLHPSTFNLHTSSFILWLLSFTACYINFGIRRFHDSFSSMYLIVGFIKSNWSFIKVCFHFTAIIKLQFHFKIFAKQPYKREDKHNTLQKYILIQYELLLGPFDWL